MPWGSYDRCPIEMRDDVLIFPIQPLARDLEITGPITVHLFAATDGRTPISPPS